MRVPVLKVWIRGMRGDDCWRPVCGYHLQHDAAQRRADRLRRNGVAAVVMPSNQSPNRARKSRCGKRVEAPKHD